MVNREKWETFRSTGMLWFANTILHAFGWAIVVEVEEDGTISGAFPARVKFRGFSDDKVTEGYIKISEYMKENAETLLEEARS